MVSGCAGLPGIYRSMGYFSKKLRVKGIASRMDSTANGIGSNNTQLFWVPAWRRNKSAKVLPYFLKSDQ